MLRSTTSTKDAGIDGTAIEEETPEYSIPASINVGRRDNSVESERRETCVGARPLGRRSTKELRRAKRQASSEAQNAIGEKVTKKLDELQTASSVGWQRATELHEEEVRCSIHAKRIQIIRDKMTFEKEMIRDKMTFEKEMIIAEKQLLEIDGSVFGSSSNMIIGRKSRLAALQAEYDAFIESELNSAPSSSIVVPSPSTSSFDEEANV
ncbi:hypothetical protein Droror1_Dr00009243 [Drosera rotundifolia]